MDLHQICRRTVGAAYEVANTLGCGFLEKVYERALVRELILRGLKVCPQAPVPVVYKGYPVGEYFTDILVEDALVVELKCVTCFAPEHMAQCINYLKATGLQMALLINFEHGKLEWRRIVYNLEEERQSSRQWGANSRQ